MKSIRDISNLDHSCHAMNVFACDAHVNAQAQSAALPRETRRKKEGSTDGNDPQEITVLWHLYQAFTSRPFPSGLL